MSKDKDIEKNALAKKLQQLQEELEELEEERALVLGQTGLHLPGSTVKKYEAEIGHLKKQIEEVRQIITE